MNNEWKLVPVEPTEAMYLAFDDNCDGLDSASARAQWVKLLAAAPVPSAGGKPKVVAYLCNSGTVLMMADQKNAAIWNAGHPLIELQDHLSHFTRLQAENAALQQRLTIADQRVDDLESELTKARGLIDTLSQVGSKVVGFPVRHMRDARLYLANQSAPAAKGLTEESRQEAIERHFGHFGDGE